ncbi:hypothetical protein PAXRUDRAFT_822626 [Paxillus rubicundulus Ve08.2h10]|uniref:Uncharacterized protein n=1 Tax=Paxillus rubicundulus Ve08.2h10 TaxID=930991 RepID=A0A0D0ECK9_9AGAM|nr:hypothetical protein PAXRUDRAFT_822626 [Paxillus rubicundulus Ve08.2h10]
MFGFIRRVSTSLLPRPDRPWRDDATSNAPTIGRKRRFSVTEHDEDVFASSAAKKAKGEPCQLDAEAESASTAEDTKGETTSAADGEDVKEVTKGVKDVDLEDKEGASPRPEGVPLPDSRCGTPQPESASSEEAPRSDVVEETNDPVHPDHQDSVASSPGKADGSKEREKGSEDKAEFATTTTNTLEDEVVRSKDASPDPSTSDNTEVRA